MREGNLLAVDAWAQPVDGVEEYALLEGGERIDILRVQATPQRVESGQSCATGISADLGPGWVERTSAARAATVRLRKTSSRERGMSSARARATMRSATMESPPSSKKSS